MIDRIYIIKVINISDQFVFLLQKDLELTLWKIYYDNDSKANTIPKFRNTVNDMLRNCNCPDKQVKKQKGNRKTEETVKIMRRQFLAHTDMTRDDSRIEVSDMSELLDVMCKEFNCICEVVDDDQVVGMSKMKLENKNIVVEGSCYLYIFKNKIRDMKIK